MRGAAWVCVGALVAASASAGPRRKAADPFAEFFVAPSVTDVVAGEVPKEAASAASVTAARGESEGFFVVLRGKTAEATRISASMSELRGGGGPIGKGAVGIARAEWVEIDGQVVPDALVPLDGKGVPAGVAAPDPARGVVLYVEVSVPRDAAPGEYHGQLSVRAGASRLNVPVALEVLSFEMPRRASLPAAFGFSARDAAVGAGIEVEDAKVPELARRYAHAALAHRITLLGDAHRSPSWRARPGDGNVDVDFSNFDADLGALLNGVDALGGARASVVPLQIPSALQGMQRFKYAAAFQRHLESKGWSDRLVAFDDEANAGNLLPPSMQDRVASTCSLQNCLSARALPSPTWFRVAPTGPLSLEVGASAAAPRAISWLAFARGAAGLRYANAVDGFHATQWTKSAPRSALFYPVKANGAQPQFLESLRLKRLRDGLEDYELLRAARDAGHEKLARSWAERIASRKGQITAASADWELARQELAQAAADAKPAEAEKRRTPVGGKRGADAANVRPEGEGPRKPLIGRRVCSGGDASACR